MNIIFTHYVKNIIKLKDSFREEITCTITSTMRGHIGKGLVGDGSLLERGVYWKGSLLERGYWRKGLLEKGVIVLEKGVIVLVRGLFSTQR
jgi:hypothetical protein